MHQGSPHNCLSPTLQCPLVFQMALTTYDQSSKYTSPTPTLTLSHLFLQHLLNVTNFHYLQNPHICYTPTHIGHSSINSVIQHPIPTHIHNNLPYTNNSILKCYTLHHQYHSYASSIATWKPMQSTSNNHMLTTTLHNIDFEIP